jgi:hypothetical protein
MFKFLDIMGRIFWTRTFKNKSQSFEVFSPSQNMSLKRWNTTERRNLQKGSTFVWIIEETLLQLEWGAAGFENRWSRTVNYQKFENFF